MNARNTVAASILVLLATGACAAPAGEGRVDASPTVPHAPSPASIAVVPLELVLDREAPVKRVTLAANGGVSFDGAGRAQVRGAKIEGAGGEIEVTDDGRVIVRRKTEAGEPPFVLRFTAEDDLVPEKGGPGIHVDDAGKVWNTSRASHPESDAHFTASTGGARRTAALLVVALMVFTPAPLERGGP